MILSIIIPARGEFPNITHTFHSLCHCLEADGFSYKDFEIIIVDNGSNDDRYPQRGTGGTTSYLETRGGYYNRVLRIIRDPICGNHSARNRGAEIARGEYLYFSDAHMALRPGFFKSILKSVDESGGLVHGALQFMGAYPPTPQGMGYGYSIKLGEEIKGTWNNYQISDKWFYVPAQGHWGVCVKKDQFFDFGGYPKIHRTYGGGEFYLDMKWWMFGSNVAVDPNAVGYHLASSRGYSYNHDDYVHNVFNIGVALGMDEWVERYYLNLLRKSNKQVLDRILEEAYKETEEDKKFIESRRVRTFNEAICERPWDKKNDERCGHHYSGLTIFHNTMIDLIKQSSVAWEAYQKSKYQVGLDKFIRENLSEFIYKKR
jgi:glycosyltransferase involved in cell wall biosynthesis